MTAIDLNLAHISHFDRVGATPANWRQAPRQTEDTRAVHLDDKIASYWSERGFDVKVTGLVNGLPRALSCVSFRKGNAQMPNRAHVDQIMPPQLKRIKSDIPDYLDKAGKKRRGHEIEAVLVSVAAAHHLSVQSLRGRCRKVPHKARQAAYYQLWQDLNLSTIAIGHIMDGRHYSSIVQSLKSHELRSNTEAVDE